MQASIYNFLLHSSRGNIFLVNPLYNTIIRLEPWLLELFSKKPVRFFEKRHPDFYACLLRNKFIVEDGDDEIQICVAKVLDRLETNGGQLQLTINPTLDCNLRCWYCYEEHRQGSRMSAETVLAVLRHIERKIRERKWNALHLSFFGGEPLLGFETVIIPILAKTKDLCDREHVKFSHGYTSNATLITPKRLNELRAISPNIHFQIPFDGSESNHNKVKHFANGRGCYSKVLETTRMLIQNGVSVTIRCNVTNENVNSFSDLVNAFSDLSTHKNFSFQIQKVWQERNTESLKKGILCLSSLIKKNGLQSNLNNGDAGYRCARCYADYRHNIVINYDGNVFQCTARDFTKNNRMGMLQADGEILYNDAFISRRFAQIKEECVTCRILPICPLCSQRKYETDEMKCALKHDDHVIKQNLKGHFKIESL